MRTHRSPSVPGTWDETSRLNKKEGGHGAGGEGPEGRRNPPGGAPGRRGSRIWVLVPQRPWNEYTPSHPGPRGLGRDDATQQERWSHSQGAGGVSSEGRWKPPGSTPGRRGLRAWALGSQGPWSAYVPSHTGPRRWGRDDTAQKKERWPLRRRGKIEGTTKPAVVHPGSSRSSHFGPGAPGALVAYVPSHPGPRAWGREGAAQRKGRWTSNRRGKF